MDWKLGFSRKQLATITILVLLTFAIGTIIGYFFTNRSSQKVVRLQQKMLLPAALNTQLKQVAQTDVIKKYGLSTKTFIVAKGETLAHIFHRAQLSNHLLIDILKLPNVNSLFTHMQPGQSLKITTSFNNQLHQLIYAMDTEQSLVIKNKNNKLSAKIIKQPTTVALRFKSAKINYSLTEAAIHAGIPASLIKQVKTMFAGSVNFTRDIHAGDKLKVLYEEYYVNGKKDKPGHVVAAELDTKHKKYHVIRFSEHHQSGYYHTNGHAVSSLFLKFPLIFKRISSYFNYHRLDPILHRIHPHLGVDLAAPRGTPVKAIGNGRVLLRGWVRGYGNTIMIRYNKTYKTLYGHLERFAKGLHPNEYVKKGQVVGYVGSTGWSTGPHLHFEVYKNGKPTNPLKLHFPHSPPIPKKYHQVFVQKAHHLFNEIRLFEQAQQTTKHA